MYITYPNINPVQQKSKYCRSRIYYTTNRDASEGHWFKLKEHFPDFVADNSRKVSDK